MRGGLPSVAQFPVLPDIGPLLAEDLSSGLPEPSRPAAVHADALRHGGPVVGYGTQPIALQRRLHAPSQPVAGAEPDGGMASAKSGLATSSVIET